MKLKKAEFLKLAYAKEDFPPQVYPEIVLAGRSNVGKSSIINTLLSRRNLARTSNTPGKTRAVHFYFINDSFYFVDLPGYGYAKVSKQLLKDWGSLIEEFLSDRKNLIMVILVVDIRHEPSEEDRQMAEWLRHFFFKIIIVASKVDKLTRGNREKQREVIASSLRIEPEDIILFSSKTKEGRDELLRIIDNELHR
ncbi:MAG: ribosome biogenesis GTP-binding protein YihA/YsxC [Bacillota bacterium]|nr:ribosome biogenesis GTP-binding protein YihA/YsxC [Bacillota bacterium]